MLHRINILFDLNEVPTPQKVVNLNEQLNKYGGGEKFIIKIQTTLFFVSSQSLANL